jgi:hypothetical protein
MDIFTTKKPNAPIFVFIHGGAWRRGAGKSYSFPAEMFVNAGAHYITLDFINVDAAKGDITAMAVKFVTRSCGYTKTRPRSAVMPIASISAAIPPAGTFAVSRSRPIGKRNMARRPTSSKAAYA